MIPEGNEDDTLTKACKSLAALPSIFRALEQNKLPEVKKETVDDLGIFTDINLNEIHEKSCSNSEYNIEQETTSFLKKLKKFYDKKNNETLVQKYSEDLHYPAVVALEMAENTLMKIPIAFASLMELLKNISNPRATTAEIMSIIQSRRELFRQEGIDCSDRINELKKEFDDYSRLLNRVNLFFTKTISNLNRQSEKIEERYFQLICTLKEHEKLYPEICKIKKNSEKELKKSENLHKNAKLGWSGLFRKIKLYYYGHPNYDNLWPKAEDFLLYEFVAKYLEQYSSNEMYANVDDFFYCFDCYWSGSTYEKPSLILLSKIVTALKLVSEIDIEEDISDEVLEEAYELIKKVLNPITLEYESLEARRNEAKELAEKSTIFDFLVPDAKFQFKLNSASANIQEIILKNLNEKSAILKEEFDSLSDIQDEMQNYDKLIKTIQFHWQHQEQFFHEIQTNTELLINQGCSIFDDLDEGNDKKNVDFKIKSIRTLSEECAKDVNIYCQSYQRYIKGNLDRVPLSTLRQIEDADEDEVMNFVKIAKEKSMDYSIADEFI